MTYVKMPAVDVNLWVNPESVLSLEFHNMEPVDEVKSSVIVIPDAHKPKPRCTLHLHNMQVVQFELPPDATEATVIDLLTTR